MPMETMLDEIRAVLRRDLKLAPDEPLPAEMPFFGGSVDLDSLDVLLLLALRVYPPQPEDSEYRSDERELQQRDRAHYHSYQWIASTLVVLWLLASWDVC